MTLISENRKEYNAWQGMKYRCLNENCSAFHHYGGRGIKISSEFMNSFESFLDYVGKAPSYNHSIDRIDNNGNYERGNLRWATARQQSRNRRKQSEVDRKIVESRFLKKRYKLKHVLVYFDDRNISIISACNYVNFAFRKKFTSREIYTRMLKESKTFKQVIKDLI